jgi:hypothetical protein
MRVDVDASRGQTVLLRILNGAYNSIKVTFPVDVVVIAFDGRALGVPPFARYNHAYEVRAGETIHLSTARRFDALIRSDEEVDDVATVQFIDSRGQNVRPDSVRMTARIPIRIR